jgi:hypothetical protein
MNGSQFEVIDNYSNEHCGKSKHLSDGEDNRTVTNCNFLVVLITNGSYTNEVIKKRISLSKPAMANLTKIIKVLEVSTNTKVKLL